jgi:ParB family chromosome partitioning protein
VAAEIQKSALGKGLASLLPGAASAALPTSGAPAATQTAAIPGITFLQVSDIQVNQYQPRRSFEDQPLDELSQSIRVNGIIQPLVVRRTDAGYQLIAGERRLRAAKLAGLRQVPVVVRRTTDKEALELALVDRPCSAAPSLSEAAPADAQ